MQTEYILNLEDGLINKVDFWTKHLVPVVKINDLETKGVQNFDFWFKEFPLVIENPEDYIPVYKKLKTEKLVIVHKVTNKSYVKNVHPLSLFKDEYIFEIQNTWGNKKGKGMLVAGGIGNLYTSCRLSENQISLNDGDDAYLYFEGSDKELKEMWQLLKIGAPFKYNQDFLKLGFEYD